MKVLVADDDPIWGRLVCVTLERNGFQPLLVSDGVEALAVLQSEDPPRLALLDWVMPRLDGVSACRQIRADKPAPYIYIILLTGKSDPSDVVAGLNAGADDYLVKPFNVAELIARVKVGERVVNLHGELLRAYHASESLNVELRNEIDKRVQVETNLRSSEATLKVAQAAAQIATWNWNPSDGTLVATEELFRLYGTKPTAGPFGLARWLARVHPEDRERVSRQLEQVLATEDAFRTEYRICRPDGAVRYLIGQGQVCRDPDGKLLTIIGANIDVTDLKQAELAAQESEERFRRVFANAAIGMIVIGLDGRFMEVNDLICKATGYTRAELLQMSFWEFMSSGDKQDSKQCIAHMVEGARGEYIFEGQATRKNGDAIWFRFSLSPLLEDGQPAGLIVLCEDISDRKKAEAKLEYQAFNDELTGLPNRRLFHDRLSQALALAKRQSTTVALFHIGLDGFKAASDMLGLSGGDFLIREAAARLRIIVRESDTIARVGQDEFAVVVGQIKRESDAELVAGKLLAQLASPFVIERHELVATGSIGISFFPQNETDLARLVQQAKMAMSAAKLAGKNKTVLFSAELGRLMDERIRLENQLRGAISRDEFIVHYQPEFDLVSGQLVRFEALARWARPGEGMISPAKFIPIAEETGLIIPLGEWIMEKACLEAVQWQQLNEHPVQVAVNVSAIEFSQEDFTERVTRIVEQTGLNPELLQIELTESVAMAGVEAAAAKMTALRDMGISIALDDFGTGYSAISYLRRLPCDCLKIDRSFVAASGEKEESVKILQSLVGLAHNLNMTAIAEGIETAEQLGLLQQIGCDEAQGYLLGRPAPNPSMYLTNDERGGPNSFIAQYPAFKQTKPDTAST